MNGAIAEVCARISKAPNSSTTHTIGTSQNFFRILRKAHSSVSTDMAQILPSVRARSGIVRGECRMESWADIAINGIGDGLRALICEVHVIVVKTRCFRQFAP